ncbi:MAG TPA: S-methyl-5'-thioadenosine phosphorylase [Acidobacteriota bacterium]
MTPKRQKAAKPKPARPALRQARAEVGILGGTGLYEVEGIESLREIRLKTPFGDPSDAYLLGRLEGREVAFLSRHGRGHRYLPMEINYRANIYGFKMLGVERIISVNSCGSLKKEIKPKDIVISDQFFDRTHRLNTFFGGGVAAHIGLAHPVCSGLAGTLTRTGRELGLRIHPRGIYLCIEGPAFSTKAESNIYRQWGCDVIGMTAATEAKLCREAEICYASMNLVTDYDVWHSEEETVSVELILQNLRANIEHAKAIIKKTLASLGPRSECGCDCGLALRNVIVTAPGLIPGDLKKKLRPLVKGHLQG